MHISKQQEKAISHNTGPALVLAVPGSGKTTVLLNRIIYLNDTHFVHNKQILNLTFSKTQATDMSIRFKKISNGNANFSTIHAFAYNIINIYSKVTKTNYTLIEGNNQFNKYNLLNRLFWESYNTKATSDDLDYFFSNYGLIKNNMLSLNDLQKDNHFSKIALKYEEFKKNNNLIDFDDMLTFSYEILKNNDNILSLVKNRYKYFQLDEGQDASLIQFKILELISYPNNNIFILADDDQSIYSFRGANPTYLLNINSVFKNINFYHLNKNYRSTKDIVMLSDFIIKRNKIRYEKSVESHSNTKTPIQIIRVKNIEYQNKFILKEISNLNESENLAILFRNNISAYAVSYDLLKNNISFGKRLNFNSNSVKFVLKDIIDIIDFAYDLSNKDIFLRIYYKLNLYLKKDYVKNIFVSYNESILDVILEDTFIKDYQRDLIENLKNILSQILKLNLEDSLLLIFNELGYIEYISKRFDNIPIEYIQEILLYISKNKDNISELQNEINCIESILKNKIVKNNNIFISTIHQSKGLEYDNVILIDLVDGEFPIYNDEPSSFEEERRLFYVGITRAKKNLYLLAPKYRYLTRVKPSKFFAEIQKISK